MLYANGYPVGGGGGGTGGHTIIDENGNSMTAREGLQFVGANVSDDSTNNKTIVDLASAGGIDGVFIDTDNVIDSQSGTMVNGTPYEYTALEDCFVSIYTYSISNGKSWTIKINNVLTLFYEEITYSNMGKTIGFFVKKGDSLYISTSDTTSRSVSLEAYGIQTGTTHSKFQPVIYSLEEREIGVWTDGKPLYEKTINFGALPNNTTTDVAHNISNIDKTVYISAVGIRETDRSTSPIPYVHRNNLSSQIQIYVGETNISISTASDYSNRNGYVTLRYTKTTDTAGSGSWTPQGVPTHHYSTDEQVIGTWIDGKTLYEKTFDYSSNPIPLTPNTWLDSGIPASINIDKLVGHTLRTETGEYSLVEVTKGASNYTVGIRNDMSISNRNMYYLTIQYTKSV